jgi:hypothetical protein
MIWAQLCVDFCAALMFGACMVFGILTAERKRNAFPQAEQKALSLLRSWLSPEQAQQYDSQKYFDVIGSDTGTRYRIQLGRIMNVDQLDSAGNKVCAWCFGPGDLANGDCMLAQKIALETFESEALAIANRSQRTTAAGLVHVSRDPSSH